MSTPLSGNTEFQCKIRDFYKKNKDSILDIILFGSTVKGKEKPEDTDILVIYKDKEDLETNYTLKKLLGNNVQITSKTYTSLLSESFKAREAILSEGYSLIRKELMAQSMGFFSTMMFKYSLEGKNKSERMRFYYSLYGRGKNYRGIIKELDLIKFSDTILLAPITQTEKTREFLESWKIEYKEFPVLMPARLKNILQ